MKVIIIGGVAAGASAAARLRRLDETAEILLLEKGAFISYANCGLPYHLGGVIPDRDDLLIMPPKKFAAWFNIDVRTQHEVTLIDRATKTVHIQTPTGMLTESYDKLLIATGSLPIGEQTVPGVYPLWTLSDMDRILVQLPTAKRAVVVGAGFVGLEVAENLRHRGMEVTIVQRDAHVLPTFDREMAVPLEAELRQAGICLRCGCTVQSYTSQGNTVVLQLEDGDQLQADLVINAIGVRPNAALAQACGLACGVKGHIQVNAALQTSDPDIYAAGDVIEVVDPIFGGPTAIPLAGPANKQGRLVANHMCGLAATYQGSLGASVLKVGNLTAAAVGYTEAKLRQLNRTYRKLYLHPASNASYYPGGSRLSIKVLFGNDGQIYGAQAVGVKGVDKRIDAIAQAMRNQTDVRALSTLELAYAPPYNSAKDPVNFVGFVAENILSGASDVVYPDQLPADAVLLDVREPEENEHGALPGAINIRLGELRSRLNELDRAKPIVCYCQVGLRGYLAERILKQHGFTAMNLSGGWLTWKLYHPALDANARRKG